MKNIKQVKNFIIKKGLYLKEICDRKKFKAAAAIEILIIVAVSLGLAIAVQQFFLRALNIDLLPAMTDAIKGFFK